MKLKRKTFLSLLLFAFILSFFVTPLGHFSKVFLNRLFAFGPKIIPEAQREQIADYNWKLKDPEWSFFNFERSKGKVVFINFWASWRLPSEAELKGIEALYDTYGDQVDFYIITDEERPPVEEFMRLKKFHFPLTYLIIGERAPVETQEPPRTYLIDKEGYIVIDKEGIADWDTKEVREVIEELIAK